MKDAGDTAQCAVQRATACMAREALRRMNAKPNTCGACVHAEHRSVGTMFCPRKNRYLVPWQLAMPCYRAHSLTAFAGR